MSRQVGTIILCGNLTQHVYSTLLSVERQIEKPGEIVLVADGSTADTARPWLARLAETRGHIFVTTSDTRPGAVRNAGVDAASSAYVSCLDAGDLLDPSFFTRCGSALDADDNVHLVTTKVLMLGPGIERRIIPQEPRDLDQLLGDTSLAHSASVFRRDTWLRLDGFDAGLPCLDDYELFLRILRDGRHGVFVDHPLLIRAWRAEARYHHFWGSEARLDAFRTIVERHLDRFIEDPVAALYPRERHLHTTATHYRRLVARHDKARNEIDHLESEIDARRGALSPDDRDVVDFADLRRTSPVARNWGYERGVPIDRHYIETFLDRHAEDIHGLVLEVQESDYTKRFGGERVTRSDVVDISVDNHRATVISDMRCAVNLPSDTYDCVIITQTLHVIDDMPLVARECARVLRPGGVLLATLPCSSRVCLEYGYAGDFWRVTIDGARQVFAGCFPPDSLEVEGRGNTLVTTAFLYGLACHELRDSEFEVDDPYNPTLVTVRAVKAGTSRRLDRTGAGVRATTTVGGPAAILLYHAIGSRTVDPHRLSVSEAEFRAQVAHLRDRYTLMPLTDLSETVRQGSVPPNVVAVSFDDGYADNLTTASPILTDLEVSATFFVTTDRLDTKDPDTKRRDNDHRNNDHYEYWWDVLSDCLLDPALQRPPTLRVTLGDSEHQFQTETETECLETHWALYRAINDGTPTERERLISALVTWCNRQQPSDPMRRRMSATELAELSRRPGHTVGAHTARHLMLPAQTADVQLEEMTAGRTILQSLVGGDVSTLAYPFGAVDDVVAEVARSVGFDTAVTCQEATVRNGLDTLRLPRLEVRPDLRLPFDEWLAGHLRG